jgi:hypothetical protein
MLQETFWDNAYVEGIEDMYEGKIIYIHFMTCGGFTINSFISNITPFITFKGDFSYSDNNGRFIHISYEDEYKLYNFISIYGPLQLNEHNRTILTTRRQKYINISILFFI